MSNALRNAGKAVLVAARENAMRRWKGCLQKKPFLSERLFLTL